MNKIIRYATIALFLGSLFPLGGVAEDEYDRGKNLYENRCLLCHGVNGNGNGPLAASLSLPPTDFTVSKFWRIYNEKEAAEVIRNGRGGVMPAFDMKPNEIRAILDYINKAFKK